MLISLTNATENFEGNELLLNTDHVLSIFEVGVDDKKVTNIYAVTKESWQVKESIAEIKKLIKQ